MLIQYCGNLDDSGRIKTEYLAAVEMKTEIVHRIYCIRLGVENNSREAVFGW